MGVMKRETKLVEGVAVASLSVILIISTILQPTGLSVAALAICSLLALFAVRRQVKKANPAHPPPSSDTFPRPQITSPRSQEIELVTDRLVLAVEEMIKSDRESGDPFNRAAMRQEIHRRRTNESCDELRVWIVVEG